MGWWVVGGGRLHERFVQVRTSGLHSFACVDPRHEFQDGPEEGGKVCMCFLREGKLLSDKHVMDLKQCHGVRGVIPHGK